MSEADELTATCEKREVDDKQKKDPSRLDELDLFFNWRGRKIKFGSTKHFFLQEEKRILIPHPGLDPKGGKPFLF